MKLKNSIKMIIFILYATLSGCEWTSPAVSSKEHNKKNKWHIDENTTGLKAAGINRKKLPLYSGPTVVPANTIISEKWINKKLNLGASNITIEKCLIYLPDNGQGTSIMEGWNSSSPIKFRYCEFDGSAIETNKVSFSCAFSGIASFEFCYIHDVGSGIALFDSTEPLLFEGNYITRLRAGSINGESSHNDGFTIRIYTGPSVTIKNNRIDCSSGHDTAAIFLQANTDNQTNTGKIKNIYIEANLLEGMGYNLAVEYNTYGYENIHCNNNLFSGSTSENTGNYWGPTTLQGGSGWTTWDNNHKYSATAIDYKGEIINEPIPSK